MDFALIRKIDDVQFDCKFFDEKRGDERYNERNERGDHQIDIIKHRFLLDSIGDREIQHEMTSGYSSHNGLTHFKNPQIPQMFHPV